MKYETKTLYHRSDPETSREVAEKMVESGKLAEQEALVLRAIESTPGSSMKSFNFTAKELTQWTMSSGKWISRKLGYFIIQRRLSGLREKGKIRRTGEKRDGCCVWELI